MPRTPGPASERKVRLPKTISEHEIQTVSLDKVVGAPYNPRKITPKALEGLRASMRRFGNVQPVILNKRSGQLVLVGGHQRITLLREVGETQTQAVIVDLSPKEERALNVALNSKSLTGTWDDDLLTPLLEEIQADDADLFRDLNLDDLLAVPAIDNDDGEETEPDEDAEKAQPQKVVSYQIVFDDEGQQQKFYLLLSALRKWYPDLETMGARIAQYAEDAIAAAGAPA